MLDPTSVFARPDDVSDEAPLTREQKKIDPAPLGVRRPRTGCGGRREYGGGPPDILNPILRASQHLDADMNIEEAPPTKHEGE